jgi:N-acetyl-1-D-myo-inositol-2-amino-2-deoxy-alpha-D-glucopyranoside deacetylase
MMGSDANKHPRAFWGADLDEAAGLLVEIMREVKPQVMVTYDPNGFYGHPDHIQAHRVAMRAAELAGADAPKKIYWTAIPFSVLKAGIEVFAESEHNPFSQVTDVSDLPFGTPDEQISACIDGSNHHDAKVAALRAHATQIPQTSWLFSMAQNFAEAFMGVEYFVLAAGKRGPSDNLDDWENDLFAGL